MPMTAKALRPVATGMVKKQQWQAGAAGRQAEGGDILWA